MINQDKKNKKYIYLDVKDIACNIHSKNACIKIISLTELD